MNGVTTEYYLDGSSIVAEKTGTDVIWYLYDGMGLAGFELNGTSYYYVYNGQGDVIGILDSSGNRVVTYTYDSWGSPLSVTGSLASTVGQKNPIRYRGYYYDTETGLYYLQSRYYDPVVGRFLNADDVMGVNSDIHAYNLFAYCGNNPVCRVDSQGQSWWSVVAAAVAVVVVCAVVIVAAPVAAPVLGAATAATIASSAATVGMVASTTGVMATVAAGAETLLSSNDRDNERNKSKTQVIPAPKIPRTKENGTKIYRSASGTVLSFTPRPGKDDDGLSFYLTPPSGKYFVTTVEDINATGFLTAIVDGPNHCSVRPTLVPTKYWAASRGKLIPSFYTLLLMSTLDGPYYG